MRKDGSIFPIAVVPILLTAVIASMTANAATPCSTVMEAATRINATQLWDGADICAGEGDMARASFLLLAGQVRAMTDMTILEPIDEDAETRVGELYGVLYYHAAGSGDDTILRDPTQAEALFTALREWVPESYPTYDPGWSYDAEFDTDDYRNMVACQKASRLSNLQWYASLIRDDRYNEAQQDLDNFHKRFPGATTVGTPEHEEVQEILTRMQSIAAEYPRPSGVPQACEFAMHFEPDPDADFKQLLSGANGPAGPDAYAFESRDDVLSSWIAEALTMEEMDSLLNEVNFDTQILAALTFGKRHNATGTIQLTNLDLSKNRFEISGRVGVSNKACEVPRSEAYPFVLGVAPRPHEMPRSRSISHQNFADGCKPAMSGKPSALQR